MANKVKEYFKNTPTGTHVKRALIAVFGVLFVAQTAVLIFILAKPKFKSIFVTPDKENTEPLSSSTLDSVLIDIHEVISK